MENRRIFVLAPVGLALILLVVLVLVQTMAASSPRQGPAPGLASDDADAAAFAGAPVTPADAFWSSGWAFVPAGECRVFDHNLAGDPDNYAVELWFRDTDDGLGMNRLGYGGLDDNGQRLGAHWERLTENTIAVCRGDEDAAADLVSVRVWDPPEQPDYVGPWTDINPGQTAVFAHGLGITETELTVGVKFSGTVRGIHNLGYGGLAINALHEMRGAHWHDLTVDSVQVTRHPQDPDIEQVRVTVVQGVPPAYDSLEALGDWQPVARAEAFTFPHGLNWNPDLLLVRAECYSDTVGIHQWFAGGNNDWFVGWQGANIQNLTDNAVTVFRQGDDQVCPTVRVRIWTRGPHIFLPLVLYDGP